MNVKRFIIASLVIFVCFEAFDFVVHGLILGSTYESMEGVWRSDMMDKMWAFHVMNFVWAFLFLFIFYKGYEHRGIAEGVRYGLIIGLFTQIPAAFSQHILYPIPFGLAMQWFIYGMIGFIIFGIVAAAVYKPKKA